MIQTKDNPTQLTTFLHKNPQFNFVIQPGGILKYKDIIVISFYNTIIGYKKYNIFNGLGTS